ncbi:MAG: Chemotaxis protein methyltransferase CheR [Labilithrix sp.]|nr:Chemotaxis protein methyltransferase CheR [Labilithrix sp.]
MSNLSLEPAEFDALRTVIRDVAGIQLGSNKQQLVLGRLAPRLRALGLSTFTEYLRHLERDRSGAEIRELVNCITTNKTSFFREPHHFELLRTKIVPELIARAQTTGNKRIRIWSAGCSTGQEPWSIAMTLADALGSLAGWDIRILASDLDTNVLETAERATYDDLAVGEIPLPLRRKYLEVAPNGESRVVRPLRDLVTFRRLNLVEPSTWTIRTRFDVVFCRNVAIYFDRDTQETVFRGLAAHLEPTGYLMSGHSENLHWLSSVLRAVGSTVHVLAGVPSAASSPSDAPGRSLAPPGRSMAPPVMSLRPGAVASNPLIITRPPATRSFSVVPGARSLGPAARAVMKVGTLPDPAVQVRLSAPPLALASIAPGGQREVAIQVGGIHASAKGALIRTTLGSCVAACVFDPEARIGGMNHFLLPEDRSGSRGPTNFGIHAMELLINSVMKLGGDRRRFVAKLFGGADQHGATARVGQLNTDFAKQYLEDEGIPIVAEKLGGISAMSIVFDTTTGKVLVKLLERTQELANAERVHRAALAAQVRPVEDDIVFFGTS